MMILRRIPYVIFYFVESESLCAHIIMYILFHELRNNETIVHLMMKALSEQVLLFFVSLFCIPYGTGLEENAPFYDVFLCLT